MAEESENHTGLTFDDEIGLLTSEPYENVTTHELSDYSHCVEVSHLVVYAELNTPVLNVFNPKAAVLMQLRFDGHLGFPGGLVDAGETPEEAVNRELVEENGLEPGQLTVVRDDLLAVHYSSIKKLLLYFFVKKVSLNLFVEIEKKTLSSLEWGDEVMGVVRVPLYTMADGFRGFPAFLSSPFIGNSKEQLLLFLQSQGLMSLDEIEKAKSAKPLVLHNRHSKQNEK